MSRLVFIPSATPAPRGLFERGDDAKQVQRWLGHHASSFTLHTYIHLLQDDLDAPLDVVAPRARSLKSLYDAIVT